jgi:hypothetical protein
LDALPAAEAAAVSNTDKFYVHIREFVFKIRSNIFMKVKKVISDRGLCYKENENKIYF